MPFGWPFTTMIRDERLRSPGGRKRDRGKAKAARNARKRNRP